MSRIFLLKLMITLQCVTNNIDREARMSDVGSLRRFEADSISAAPIDTSDDVCSICYDDLVCTALSGQQECITLPACGHQFHLQCLDTWVQYTLINKLSLRCPLCRREVKRDVQPRLYVTVQQREQETCNCPFVTYIITPCIIGTLVVFAILSMIHGMT